MIFEWFVTLFMLIKKLIEVWDCLGNYIDHCNWKKQGTTECHSKVHYTFVVEASQSRDEIAENGDLKEEGGHESHFDSEYISHI